MRGIRCGWSAPSRGIIPATTPLRSTQHEVPGAATLERIVTRSVAFAEDLSEGLSACAHLYDQLSRQLRSCVVCSSSSSSSSSRSSSCSHAWRRNSQPDTRVSSTHARPRSYRTQSGNSSFLSLSPSKQTPSTSRHTHSTRTAHVRTALRCTLDCKLPRFSLRRRHRHAAQGHSRPLTDRSRLSLEP